MHPFLHNLYKKFGSCTSLRSSSTLVMTDGVTANRLLLTTAIRQRAIINKQPAIVMAQM